MAKVEMAVMTATQVMMDADKSSRAPGASLTERGCGAMLLVKNQRQRALFPSVCVQISTG